MARALLKWWAARSLLTRYGVVSFAVVLALGSVLAGALRDTLVDRTLADAQRAAVIATTTGIQPLFQPEDLLRNFVPLTPERIDALDAALAGVTSEEGVVRMKVWNASNWIVYSDNERLRGRWFPGPALLKAALDGQVVSEITDLSAPEEVEDRDFGTLLAVYVPLAVDGDPSVATVFSSDPDATTIGSFEVYLPYAPIAAQMAEESRRLVALLTVGLLLLWAVLFKLVAAASRRLAKQAEANRYLAEHDTLTGLLNRTALARRLEEFLARGLPTAVAIIDLRRFQDINDTLGHGTGDELLRQIADRLRAALGDGELVGRMGGDEFGLVLTGLTSQRAALRRVRALMAVFAQPYEIDGVSVEAAGTAGVTFRPEGECTSGDAAGEPLVQEADIALYQTKGDGATIGGYDPTRNHFTRERLELAAQIRPGIAAGEFEIAYQPQLNVRTGRVHSVEALIRWRHPTLGLLMPGSFIEVAERTDLIRALTASVLDQSLAQVRRWRDEGLRLRISVNLSARDCTNPGLPRQVAEALARHGLQPESLTLELTESAMLTNPTAAEVVLRDVADMGVEIAIDDFGTGYASLAYVRRMPVSELKIDRSFVQGLHDGGPDADVVRFTTDLGGRLHLRVVAEGVEHAEDMTALAALGCHVVQGYHIARPMDAVSATGWLHDAHTVGVPSLSHRAARIRALVGAGVAP